jgi:hypothetical protein
MLPLVEEQLDVTETRSQRLGWKGMDEVSRRLTREGTWSNSMWHGAIPSWCKRGDVVLGAAKDLTW